MNDASSPQELLSEDEASVAAGVSQSTLRRFVEIGVLRTISGSDGAAPRYNISELEQVFSVQIPRARRPRSFLQDTPEPNQEASEDSFATAPEAIRPTPSVSSDAGRGFRQVIELQERLLAAKDVEIADLKSQREWLQSRIEKLEQQSDRDKLILLSETQTIKQLIAIESNRKSKVRAALEFFGIIPVKEPLQIPHQTFEMPAVVAQSTPS
jgi:hypothetical protein